MRWQIKCQIIGCKFQRSLSYIGSAWRIKVAKSFTRLRGWPSPSLRVAKVVALPRRTVKSLKDGEWSGNSGCN